MDEQERRSEPAFTTARNAERGSAWAELDTTFFFERLDREFERELALRRAMRRHPSCRRF